MFSSSPRRSHLAVLSLSMVISAMLPAQAFEPQVFGSFLAPQVMAPTAVENVFLGPLQDEKTSAEDIPLVLDDPGAAAGFDPQPDPPGAQPAGPQAGLNNLQITPQSGGPQPDPPGAHILIGLNQGPDMSPRDAASSRANTPFCPSDPSLVGLPGGLPNGAGMLPIPNVGIAGALNTTPCTALPALTNFGNAGQGFLLPAVTPATANLGAALGNLNAAPIGRSSGVQQAGPIQNMALPNLLSR